MKLAATLALVGALNVSANAALADVDRPADNGGDAGVVLVLLIGALILAGGLTQPAAATVGE